MGVGWYIPTKVVFSISKTQLFYFLVYFKIPYVTLVTVATVRPNYLYKNNKRNGK